MWPDEDGITLPKNRILNPSKSKRSGHRVAGRALKPLVDELPELELKYLRAMSECLDEERLAATGAIAQTLGVESRRLSRARSRLIDNGTIAAPTRGQVMFCVPHLADYVRRPESASSAIETVVYMA